MLRMFKNRKKRKKFGQGGGQKHEIGHFKNVQNAKGSPDFYQKSGFSDLEHNAANCDFSLKML
jgi:hypothetical protein